MGWEGQAEKAGKLSTDERGSHIRIAVYCSKVGLMSGRGEKMRLVYAGNAEAGRERTLADIRWSPKWLLI